MAVPSWYERALAPTPAPSISVVTPSFNQAEFLDATIRSVVEQGYPRLEYVVRDGGSTDGSAEILKRRHSSLANWSSEPDGGQSNALNMGFAASSGEIMAYLNSDDLLLPGSLAYVASFFARRPDVDVVYGHRILIDGEGREIGRWILPAHDGEVLRWADFVPQETLFWRRRIWDRVGGRLDESFQFALDWDLLLRFQAAGARFVRLPRFLGAFRVHDAQKTQVALEKHGEPEMARLRQRCHGRPVSQQEIRAHLFWYFAKHVAYRSLYAAGALRP